MNSIQKKGKKGLGDSDTWQDFEMRRELKKTVIGAYRGNLQRTETQQQIHRAANFHEMLNRPQPDEDAGQEDIDVNVDIPTKEDIIAVIKSF